ncbi:MAG: hypothetical protein OHK93_000923 [Ramalina farinacea]|uniref:Uncharacterized protein n=1 Tax=Ramalina farinacea TaxID=258253 RepID=A0AA43QST8_9LECA|nr:hypothetical protein [Ramalina farinacea]
MRAYSSLAALGLSAKKSESGCIQGGVCERADRDHQDESDVAQLRKQRQPTTQLIEAEHEHNCCQEEAEQLGAFDDGWGQDSYYGDNEATVQSLGDGEAPKGGFKALLGEDTLQEIEAWLVHVSETESPDLIIQFDFDQWTSPAIDLSDSLSVVDWSSNGRRIAEWELKCDDHRDDWRGCDECYGTLTTIDCNEAIKQLPNDLPSDVTYDPATQTFTYPLFSKTISNPRFNLPIEEESGECLVQISLASSFRSDRSLWSIIRRRAGAIMSECMVDGHGVGGYQMTGENEGIRVTLQQATGTLSNEANGSSRTPLSTLVETT